MATVTKFRRKPVEVQAVQFNGTEGSGRAFAELRGGKFFGVTINSDSHVSVGVAFGLWVHNFTMGEWAIKDEWGFRSVLSDADFRAQYEEVK